MCSSLSNQLNEKSTHLLLELLQNADDNTYTCPNPTLNFTYRRGSLRVDCNEVGFTRRHVEAICTIGQSTKAGIDHSEGYVGEKGIGFKSVFKVADVVWISSREYTFKFDKKERLGMISPIWADFPEPRLPEYTSFLLQLPEDYDEEELVQDLIAFDPTLLIFLRRVNEINLRVTQENGCMGQEAPEEDRNRRERRCSHCLAYGTGKLAVYRFKTHSRVSSPGTQAPELVEFGACPRLPYHRLH